MSMTAKQEEIPAFSGVMGSLSYNPDEIEHPMYMFDHRCVGCVVLHCRADIDARRMGEVTLDGVKVQNCFFFEFSNLDVPMVQLLGVKIRGMVDYNRTYTLHLEDFYAVDGEKIAPAELTLIGTDRLQPSQKRYEEHDKVALQAAQDGMVLLKNEDNLLPLPPCSVLNLFGSGVTDFRSSVIGAGRINPRFIVSLREAIQNYSSFTLNQELDDFYKTPNDSTPEQEVLQRAKEQSDTAVIIITRGTGENIDNQPIPGEYYLSDDEITMIDAVCSTFEKVVAVLNTGYPIDMNWTKRDSIKGIIYAGIAGQGASIALCRILEGVCNPSAKLPDTWAWDYFDIPASVNFYHPAAGGQPILADHPIWADTCYEEGIYVGYRYFETFQKKAAYYFGQGLSYTTFEKRVESLAEQEHLKLRVNVKNTGKRAGREVVMLYVQMPGTIQEQPAKQLVSFAKTKELKPGECEELVLEVQKKQLATYVEAQNAWMIESGSFQFYLGGSVHEAELCGTVKKEQESVIQQLTYRMPSPVEIKEISPFGKQWPEGSRSGLRPERTSLSYPFKYKIEENPESSSAGYVGDPIKYSQVVKNPSLLNSFVAQMSVDELARLNVMYGSGWGMENKGEAGKLAVIDKYELPDYACADGNCGVNLLRPNIGMPTSVVLCASFDTELALKVGKVIGEEAKENDIRMILATAMNIHRNPLNGRHPEYFSEDPYLAGQMAGAQVKGLHQVGISDSVKHVACNNCETARKRNHSLVGERALREIYLRTFEYLIDVEKPDTMMTGYNAVNGSMCGDNAVLLEGILREELGFDGFAMTDWNSYDTVDMVSAVNAGISWLTPGENDGSRVAVLLEAVKNGALSRAVLEQNIRRVFAVILRRDFEWKKNR